MALTIGIIGGMGPLAAVDMMRKIIVNTPAKQDQDHLHIILDNDPAIPDRTAAILRNGTDPTPKIIESAQRLENAGVDVIVIACNTAHYFLPKVQEAVHIPILNMPMEAARYASTTPHNIFGLLATTGTVRTGLYQSAFESYGLSVLIPDSWHQKLVMEGIYAVKAGNLETGSERITVVTKELLASGAQAIIAGCTEIPIVLSSSINCPVIDPTDILAKAAVKFAMSDVVRNR